MWWRASVITQGVCKYTFPKIAVLGLERIHFLFGSFQEEKALRSSTEFYRFCAVQVRICCQILGSPEILESG